MPHFLLGEVFTHRAPSPKEPSPLFSCVRGSCTPNQNPYVELLPPSFRHSLWEILVFFFLFSLVGSHLCISVPLLFLNQQHFIFVFIFVFVFPSAFSQPFRTRLDSLILTCPFQVGYPVILWFLGRDRGLLLPLPWRSCRNQSSCKENFGDERHQGSGFVCVVLGLQGSIR